MSLYPYTPSSGSDSSADDRTKRDGGWWQSTKDAIKKPWKWKRDEAKKTPPSRTTATQPDHWKRERPFGAFPPIMAQLTPNVYQQERRSSNPEDRLPGKQEDFDLPEYGGQRRPRLDSVFPMHHTPSVAAGGGGKNTPSSSNVGPRQGASGKAVGRSSSFNETDGVRERERRRRKEEGEQGYCVMQGHIRGDSVDSNNSGERTIDRRKRRMGAVRALPKLPSRRNYDQDWNDVHSLPEVSHRRRRLIPVPLERGRVDLLHHHYNSSMNPPRGTQNFSYPHWGSPAGSLPTLAEESDSGDIKGFDNFKLY